MANITDNQIRGIALQKAYDKRREGLFAWSNEDFKDLDPSIDFDIQDLFRACEQLQEHGLIEFKFVSDGKQILDGRVKISGLGVDVIEGHAQSPISINLDQSHHVTVTGSSNVQIGNSNSQNIDIHVESLLKAIDAANGSDADKKEAKSRLQRFLDHPLVSTIISGVISNIKP